jgi:hypothetical protein
MTGPIMDISIACMKALFRRSDQVGFNNAVAGLATVLRPHQLEGVPSSRKLRRSMWSAIGYFQQARLLSGQADSARRLEAGGGTKPTLAWTFRLEYRSARRHLVITDTDTGLGNGWIQELFYLRNVFATRRIAPERKSRQGWVFPRGQQSVESERRVKEHHRNGEMVQSGQGIWLCQLC